MTKEIELNLSAMTKEAIQYLTELGIHPEARLIEKNNRLFNIDSQGDVTQ